MFSESRERFIGNECVNSYVYYVTRGFVASARVFNFLTRTFNFLTCAFNLPTRAFSILTRGFKLVTRGFELVTCISELVTRNLSLVFYFFTCLYSILQIISFSTFLKIWICQ